MNVSIDIGGTNTRVASSNDLLAIYKSEKFPTDKDFIIEKELINSAILKVTENTKPEFISIGVPGFVERKERKFGYIINVPSLSHFSYQALISDIPVENIVAENDAVLAGLAEAVSGAGKEHDVVAYLTLSTGVGGVRIVNKKIDPYMKFSEPGHMIIKQNGRSFKYCNQKGCLSAYASGTAFEEIHSISPVSCIDKETWDKYAEDLSAGLINVIVMWSPDIIVLGGSMSLKYDEYFKDPLLKELVDQNFVAIPPIVKSMFEDDSGLLGGFELIKQTYKI